MGPKQAITTCFRKYITFSGRAARPEFWYFILFLAIGTLCLVVLSGLIFGPTVTQTLSVKTFSTGEQTTELITNETYDGGLLLLAFQVLTALPLFAVSWRRLHDTGRRGWWTIGPLLLMFLTSIFNAATLTETAIDPALIPEGGGFPETMPHFQYFPVSILLAIIQFVFALILLFWLIRPSQPGPNAYGPNPNEVMP